MKAVVQINHLHLLAPTVAAASQLTQLLARCVVLDRRYDGRSDGYDYVVEEGDRAHLRVTMDVVPPSRVRARVPKGRRLSAGPDAEGGQ